MFHDHQFAQPNGGDDVAALRQELREIARHMRELSAASVRAKPMDLLSDQIRAQITRIEERRAA